MLFHQRKHDLWPKTLKFNRVLAVVKVHVRTKYRQAECSGSWVIVLAEKKTPTKTIQSVATARTVKNLPARRSNERSVSLQSALVSERLAYSWVRIERPVVDDSYLITNDRSLMPSLILHILSGGILPLLLLLLLLLQPVIGQFCRRQTCVRSWRLIHKTSWNALTKMLRESYE